MLKNKYFVALAILALAALGSCGAGHKGADASSPVNHDTSTFQVNVMPESYNLGGSTGRVFATVDQSPQPDQDHVLVNINVDQAQDLKSLYIELNYDPQQYRALTAQPTGLMGDPDTMLSLVMPTARGTVEYGQVLVQPDSQAGLTGSGIVAQVSFSREPEPAARGVSNAGPPAAADSQVTNLVFDGANLAWSYFQQGDYDQNGEVNVADLTPLGQNFKAANINGAGNPYPFSSALSQIDGDSNGEINVSDITPIGQNYLRDTLGGFHAYKSSSASDYPVGDLPLGVNGSGTTELTIAPDVPTDVSDAINYAARDTERLRFRFAVPAPVVADYYWVRPADGSAVLGVASNLNDGNPAPVPTVSSTAPVNAGTGVALNVRPTATFSQAMNQATLSATSFTLLQGTTTVTGSVTYVGVTTTFRPDSALSANTVYTASITTEAENLAGIPLNSDYVWTFETGATLDTTPPTVSSTVPVDAGTGVALNARPTATFNEALDPLTLSESTFTLRQGLTPVSGTVSYVGLVATFRPDANLEADTEYTATITTGVQDLAGNALAGDHFWTFETGATLDTTPPTVLSTLPLNGAGGVEINVQPAATFSEELDPLTISTDTFTLMQGLTPVDGTVDYLDLVATFTPAANLEADTEYTATITTDAQDLAGNPLAADYVWTFTTALVDLGELDHFGSFGGGAGMTNQGISTVVNGDIATTGASTLITGFHDLDGDIYTETPLNVGLVNGQIFTAPPLPGTAEQFVIASQGAIDAQIAFDNLSPASMPGGMDPGAGELGGLTLEPGVYMAAGGTFQITGLDLTLDAQGDPNAVWVFQSSSSLTVGDTAPRSVILINGAQAKNVYWYVGSAATINSAGGGTMVGTIIAYAGVTFSTSGNVVQTILNGRAIGLSASVTLVNTIINIPE